MLKRCWRALRDWYLDMRYARVLNDDYAFAVGCGGGFDRADGRDYREGLRSGAYKCARDYILRKG